jgi:signal transduction histidine kinase
LVVQVDDEAAAAAAAAASTAAEAERVAKEKEQQAQRIKKLANDMRFLERALREEEMPLAAQWFEEKIAREKEEHEIRIAVCAHYTL